MEGIFDWTNNFKRAGLGVNIFNWKNCFEYSMMIDFQVTNNVSKYEVFIFGVMTSSRKSRLSYTKIIN